MQDWETEVWGVSELELNPFLLVFLPTGVQPFTKAWFWTQFVYPIAFFFFGIAQLKEVEEEEEEGSERSLNNEGEK